MSMLPNNSVSPTLPPAKGRNIIIVTVLVLAALALPVIVVLTRKAPRVQNQSPPNVSREDEINVADLRGINQPPQFSEITEELLANPGFEFIYKFEAIDPDSEPLTFGIGICGPLENCSETFNSSDYYLKIDSSTGELRFIPTEENTYQIPLWVSDGTNVTHKFFAIRSGKDLSSRWSMSWSDTFSPKTDCKRVRGRKYVKRYNPFTCEPLFFQARGEISLAVIEYMLPNTVLPEALGKTYPDYLNDPRGLFETCPLSSTNICTTESTFKSIKHLSFYYLPTYFYQEAQKYGVTDLKIELEISGPYVINGITRFGAANTTSERTSLIDLFEKEARLKNIPLEKYDLIAYVFFDDVQDKITNRQPGKVAFLSSSWGERRVVLVDVADFGRFSYEGQTINPLYNGNNAVETLIHETGHLLGAFDKYEAYGSSRIGATCGLTGLGDPDKSPLFPQENADLYCGEVIPREEDLTSTTDVQRYHATLLGDEKGKGRLVINKYTARELGWLE